LRTNYEDIAQAGEIIQAACHYASASAGWWIDPDTGEDMSTSPWFPYVVGTKLMLVVSEIAEGMEGHRKNLMDDKLPHRPMLEVEMADAVIHIADLAGKLNYDLGGAIAEKMAFNAVRPDHKIEARAAVNGKKY